MKYTIFGIEFDMDTKHGPNFFLVVVFSGVALMAICIGSLLLLAADKKLVPDSQRSQPVSYLHQAMANASKS